MKSTNYVSPKDVFSPSFVQSYVREMGLKRSQERWETKLLSEHYNKKNQTDAQLRERVTKFFVSNMKRAEKEIKSRIEVRNGVKGISLWGNERGIKKNTLVCGKFSCIWSLDMIEPTNINEGTRLVNIFVPVENIDWRNTHANNSVGSDIFVSILSGKELKIIELNKFIEKYDRKIKVSMPTTGINTVTVVETSYVLE